eukprot:CAMPEP_0202113354 /NCGR_PEP_ID=MMETSP0965-20130614/33707_1 /ASSEMBLY_ACC=CAM_ASM_000507 /TAXON_ID=4773 /ORGANISM="Schizochytrium aggregatum, Strain ATCC28209" /LENGTH=73 /DNA_ID=CAMNT_0048682971 /DNA_START=190 /DNA_END=408 /DNA_ORIENTATION=-
MTSTAAILAFTSAAWIVPASPSVSRVVALSRRVAKLLSPRPRLTPFTELARFPAHLNNPSCGSGAAWGAAALR